MHWKKTGVALAAVAIVGTVVPAADAAVAWQATMMPKPADWRGGSVTGTDGKGNFSGSYYDFGGDGPTMVIWHGDDEVVSVAPPAGCLTAGAVGEIPSGVIAVAAGYCDGDQFAYRPYIYSNGGYHALALPAGYVSAETRAINVHGDVVGNASGPDGEAAVVWTATSTEPVVIPDTLPGQRANDIDDNGTVLFNTDDGPYVWRDGTLTALTVPLGWDAAWGVAMCNGVVAGHASRDSGLDRHAMAWRAPDAPVVLQAGAGRTATGCNATGLMAGDMMTWRGFGSAGSLPLPPGYDEGGVAAVGEDDSVLGAVTYYADGGREFDDPVVWRWG